MSRLQKIPIFGALSGLIKEELVEPTIDRFLRSVRGYGALGDLPKPLKADLDPAQMGGVTLPTFVEDIPFTKTESGLAVPEKKIKIEDLKGRVLTPAYGDRTDIGTLTKVDDIELTTPVKLEGGHGFMREGEGLWASEYPAMKSKAKAMKKMDDPLMVYTAMAGQAGDFSKMMSDTTLQIIKQSDISKKAAKEYDDLVKKTLKLKDWPGILSPNIAEYVDKMPGTKRRELWQQMDKKTFQDLGFPNMGVIRTAISDAELLTVPSFAAGRSIGQPTSLELRPSTHGTYSTEIIGDYKGSLDFDVPGEIIFRDFFTKMAQRLKDTGKSNPQRAMLMTPSISQKVDQQMIDEVNEFQELMFQMSPSTQGPR